MHNPVQKSDEEAWLKLIGGDEEALEFIFKKYFPVLFDYGIKLTGNPEVTRDGIQELFVYIWTRRQNLSAVRSLRAYLLTSLRRSIFKKIRSARNFYPLDTVTESGDPPREVSPEFLFIFRESEQRQKLLIQNALAQLPAKTREALYLKTYQNLSYREIAEVLGITYQVARNYIWQALKRIRAILLEKQEPA